ncbi:MAG: hypothetical protein HY553_11530 [Elusimicrobia bacterium]|nr:hypothetical protein [Elusimicrobiota bacterium]
MNTSKATGLGACLALLAMLFGFILGGAFGGAESSIKQRLADSGAAALQTAYAGDKAAMDAVVKKSWEYLQRAHLHGGAIGAGALASILALTLLAAPGRLRDASALALGAGSLLYPVFWLVAGLAAPGLGSTGAAKEAFKFLAVPGAGLCILGLCGTLACVARGLRSKP